MGVLSARALARRIMGTDPEQVADLAFCIQRGSGAFRLRPTERRSVVVLYSPTLIAAGTAPDHAPVAYVSIGLNPEGQHVYNTARLTRVFADTYCKHLGNERPLGVTSTWIPAAASSAAVLPLGGVIAESFRATTGSDDDTYRWYDLANYPIGWVIYRITSKGSLVGFVRVGPDAWVRFDVAKLEALELATQHIRASGVTAWEPDDELAAMHPPRLLDVA
jgi:hypothetical protein